MAMVETCIALSVCGKRTKRLSSIFWLTKSLDCHAASKLVLCDNVTVDRSNVVNHARHAMADSYRQQVDKKQQLFRARQSHTREKQNIKSCCCRLPNFMLLYIQKAAWVTVSKGRGRELRDAV